MCLAGRFDSCFSSAERASPTKIGTKMVAAGIFFLYFWCHSGFLIRIIVLKYLMNKHTLWWLSIQLYTFRSVPQSTQNARLFLQSSELGHPPPHLGGTHSCGREGGRVQIRTRGQTLWYSGYIREYFVVCAYIQNTVVTILFIVLPHNLV
jgi:hypothetical protein